MAKHKIDGKGFVSKGLRISSKGMKKIAVIAHTSVPIQGNSVMRQAFDNILLKDIKKNAAQLAQHVGDSLSRKVGLIRMNTWNASLSKKTADKLGATVGWNNPRARMAYDNMLSE